MATERGSVVDDARLLEVRLQVYEAPMHDDARCTRMPTPVLTRSNQLADMDAAPRELAAGPSPASMAFYTPKRKH